ncbi:hypothetical protein D3C76_658350 [compost metagenome]
MLGQPRSSLSPHIAKQTLSPDPFTAGLGAKLLRISTVKPDQAGSFARGHFPCVRLTLDDVGLTRSRGHEYFLSGLVVGDSSESDRPTDTFSQRLAIAN